MREYLKFYIDGQWVEPAEGVKTLDVINPATEEACGKIAMGSAFPTAEEFRLQLAAKWNDEHWQLAAVTRLMQTLLFNVRPADPSTMVAVAAVIASVALIACYVPARRASTSSR